MCGIALSCTANNGKARSTSACGKGYTNVIQPGDVALGCNVHAAVPLGLLAGLRARGPDHLGTHNAVTAGGLCRLGFAASLLQLRGLQPGTSPCTSGTGHVLCFNGEVFGGLEVQPGENDGACLLAALTSGSSSATRVVQVVSRLRGPWALVFWDPHQQRLWFGRDVLGRRSLLAHFPDEADPRLLLSSTSDLPASSGSAAPPAGGHLRSALSAAAAASDGPRAASTSAADAVPSPGADPAAGAARAGGGAAGAVGEDGEAEPSGSDGYWAELPPGLYSISFEGCGARRNGPVEGEVQVAGVGKAGVADVFRRLVIGDLHLVLERHRWLDQVLLELEAYRRAESLSREGSALGVAAEEPVGPGGRPGAAPSEGSMGDGGTSPGVMGAAPLRAVATPDEAAHALLAVMLAAVRVRCACIETRSPHPSAVHSAVAAYSALSAAANGPPPQPSWRSGEPFDFRTCGVTGHDATADRDRLRLGFGSSSSGMSADGAGTAAIAAASTATFGAGAAPVMILFSGGVDSVLLAALAHRALPLDVPIDLSNVCFAGGTSPDRGAARAALEELAAACPGRCWRLVEVDAVLEDVDRHRSRLLALLRPASTVMDLNIGAALWLAVAGQGTLRLPGTAAADRSTPTAHQATAPTASKHAQDGAGSTPSRLPDGDPCRGTETPASAPELGDAAGRLCRPSGPKPPWSSPLTAGQFYGSPARVVLLGHGADEQCGGYGRHRTRFRSDGLAGLARELEVDVRRLWLRNLGRDDRLVSDWGREARHPFLDEEVMRLLLNTRLDCILDMGLPAGQGDKRVLRRALQLLRLPESAARVKRAIQFGSRIGKVSNRRDFGSNRAANKKNAGGVALQDIDRAAADVAAAAWVKKQKAPRG